uniref:AT-rich interactive domain 5A n=1 Tax=Cyprinus carpio carpio TaxID=630221 RepID=A0A9J8AR42_CYPCA
MVLDPRGEVDVGEGELEDCEKKKQEMNSANQTSREMENVVSTNSSEEGSRTDQSESEERTFVTNLYCFMKERGTPIERIPHLGFKQINLWKIYKAVETLGGYDAVTARRLWKNVYDELGGSPGSTSAATCTRRHYESKTPPRLSTQPMSKAASTGVCKPLGCYPSSKELANYHRYHYRDFLHSGPPHSEKTQRSLSPWTLDGKSTTRLASYRLPSPAYSKPCWVPHASSFYKVSPRDPCRPVSLQPTFKPHMSYPQHLLKRPTTEESYLKKIPVASSHRITERKEKAKTALPLPTQQFLFHPHPSLTMPYLPTLERPRADLTEQLKALPLQPVLLPSHLTIPSAQTHSMHCPPVGNPFTGSYEPPYPYPLPIWHPPTGYNMAGLQPY